MIKNWWNKDKQRFSNLKRGLLKLWLRKQKAKLSDVRALMHLHELKTKDKLLNYDPSKYKYEWVIITKEK